MTDPQPSPQPDPQPSPPAPAPAEQEMAGQGDFFADPPTAAKLKDPAADYGDTEE